MKTFGQGGEDYLAKGFRDVDSASIDKMARCLAFTDALPSFQQYKRMVLDALRPPLGSTTADLGCGLGFDVRRLAALVGPEGRAIGVDSSLAFLESARAASKEFSSAEFIQADIRSLPFEAGFLETCKVDRTLQHVEQPVAVIKEMFRTVCSGGRIVCAEPDWTSFTINHENRTMAGQIAEFWSAGFRNPRIGSELRNVLEEAGFVDVEVQDALLIAPSFESSDTVFDITQTASRLAASSGSDEPLDWLSRVRERDAVSPVSSSVKIVINFARRP